MPGIKDITNQKFDRLTAVQFVGKNIYGIPRWLCKCDCGNSHTVTSSHLLSGTTKSCGCIENKSNYRHGHASHKKKKHPLYYVWVEMHSRCNNPNHVHYKYYGGRGIKPSPRWDDFVIYLHDILTSIGDRPPGKSLDRINNNGNYEPDNVRWATPKEQANNRRPKSRHKK